MIVEILGAFREAMAAIVESAVKTAMAVVGAFVKAASIFKTQAGTANPLETLAVVLLFVLVGYFVYKFLWDSAKTFSIFVVIIMFLFILTVILV